MSIVPKDGVLLRLYQGSTLDKTFAFYTDAAQETLKNLTGYTAALMVRKDFNPASPVILSLATVVPTLSPPELNGLIMGAALGTIRVYASDEKMATLALESFRQSCEDGETLGLGRWDLELTPANGETSRYVMGPVEFSPEITR